MATSSTGLKILEDNRKEPYIQGLKQIEITNFEDAMMTLKMGEEQRSYGVTSLHDHSSRSHTVFQVVTNLLEIFVAFKFYIENGKDNWEWKNDFLFSK